MSIIEKIIFRFKSMINYGRSLFWLIRSNLRTTLTIILPSYLCDQLLYNPDCPKDSRSIVNTPQSYGITDFETHFITTEDNVAIHAILLKRSSLSLRSSIPTFIYLHGNAGNIGHRLPNAIELFHKINCNVLLVEYRGYGLSKGSPSELGLYKDTYAALQFLYGRKDICSSKIVLFGRSLGGGVAIGTIHQLVDWQKNQMQYVKPAAMIIENTFTSIPDISRHLCAGRSRTFLARLFRLIPNWFYKNQYDSRRKIEKILLPSLFISGLSDELIPNGMMTKLFNFSASVHKELHKFESGTHNFTWKCSNYYSTIDQFLNTIFSQESQSSEMKQQTTMNDESSAMASLTQSTEKLPLINAMEEYPNEILVNRSRQPTSIVMYHSDKQITNDQFANLQSGELNAHIVQMLDSGLIPIHVTSSESMCHDLVDI
ncbi:hypothetical protein RDWZM_000777 [Blomia tropicalis]|uniref:Serine aminopeptidase S33 domain-containing protein n=1 Tax=Blomia tropicalis TaxID=40697 RepID=A0A9Q0MAZ7_BLOTA|nr:hypothetical protein RDWZM_000777 [Blomia tropicalis]